MNSEGICPLDDDDPPPPTLGDFINEEMFIKLDDIGRRGDALENRLIEDWDIPLEEFLEKEKYLSLDLNPLC